MRVVNIDELLKRDPKYKVDKDYSSIKQPMYIFHSDNEMLVHSNNKGRVINILKNGTHFIQFLNKVKQANPTLIDGIVYLNNLRVFIDTNEKKMPEDLDDSNMAVEGISYTDIPIEASYLGLYAIRFAGRGSYKLLTSGGVWILRLGTFEHISITSKIDHKTTYITSKNKYKRDVEQNYEQRLVKLLNSKKPKIADMRLFNLLFNPQSFYYMDVDKAVSIAYYGYNRVRKADRQKIIETDRFRKVFMSEMTKMFPDLIKGIQDHNSPADVGEYIKAMRTHALENGTTDDQLKVLALTVQTGYGNKVAAATDNNNIPLLLDDKPGIADSHLIADRDRYEDADLKDKVEVKVLTDPSSPTPTQPESQLKDAVVPIVDSSEDKKEGMTDEAFAEAMEENGVPTNTVIGG